MPSTQFPLWHWSAAEQPLPLPAAATQLPALQNVPATQSASSAQLVGQSALVPLQAKGAQLPWPMKSVQLPEAQLWQVPQLAEPQQMPDRQLPLWHWKPNEQVAPFAPCCMQLPAPLQ